VAPVTEGESDVADDGIEDLAAQLRRLRDIEEISNLKARYCRFVDIQDWDAFSGILTEDYRLDNGNSAIEGREAAVAMVAKGLDGGASVHHVYNPEIDVDGSDTARAIWPMDDWARLTIDGETYAFVGSGHYHEQYRRTPEGWRIASTVISRLRMERVDPGPDPA
jgi:hypothetical protein